MNFRKIASLVLAALMIMSVLSACGAPQTTTPSNGGTTVEKDPSNNNGSTANPTTSGADTAIYQVAVYGADGLPATSGIVVKFMQNGEQVAMQTMNANGVAERELEKGDYTVELKFSNNDVSYYYDTTDLTLSKTKTQLTIYLCLEQSDVFETVYVNNGSLFADEYTAYNLYTGNTYVTLKPGRNYFLYYPEIAGEYQMYTSGGTYETGYFGGMHFIQSQDVGKEAPNNGTAVSISASMISPENAFVIGVDNPGEEDVQIILHVIRISDYIDTSIPTSIYQTTAALTPWTLPSGKRVNNFDITNPVPYKLVVDADGFYHLNSVTGPLVVVFLGANAAKYMSNMVPYDTVLKNAGVSAYFEKEDGSKYREIYTQCLEDYIGVYSETTGQYTGGCIDRNSGLYPLTEDLMHIIKENGRSSGWWDAEDERYIFTDMEVNAENAWLFMCGYLG